MSPYKRPYKRSQATQTPYQTTVRTTVQTEQAPSQTTYTHTPQTPQALVASATGLWWPCLATRLRKRKSAHWQHYNNNFPVSHVCQLDNAWPALRDNQVSNCYYRPLAAASADTMQTRHIARLATDSFSCISGHRLHDRRSREVKSAGLHVRDILPTFTLKLRKERARRWSRIASAKDPGRGAGTPKTAARPYRDLSQIFRGLSRKTCCCPATQDRTSKIGGGFLEKSGLPWTGTRRASQNSPMRFSVPGLCRWCDGAEKLTSESRRGLA